MTLHLIKLCVGATSVEDLGAWQKTRLEKQRKSGLQPRLFHTTFHAPKRQDELLDGGSLYWVIKGVVQARQRLVGFEGGHKKDGSRCCLLLFDEELVPVRPVSRRAFQGWRYLYPDDAPTDLGRGDKRLATLPPRMRRELAELGLI